MWPDIKTMIDYIEHIKKYPWVFLAGMVFLQLRTKWNAHSKRVTEIEARQTLAAEAMAKHEARLAVHIAALPEQQIMEKLNDFCERLDAVHEDIKALDAKHDVLAGEVNKLVGRQQERDAQRHV